MYAVFFEQLQAALRADPPEFVGVIDVETPGGWWYVATVGNIPAPVCAPGHWSGGADFTVHVPTEPAWAGSVTSPTTLPAIVASGLATLDAPPESAEYVWQLWGIYLQRRIDFMAANPAP